MALEPTTRAAISLEVPAAEVELVVDRLFGLGATAVSEEEVSAGVRLVADLDPAAVRRLAEEGLDPQVVAPRADWDDGWRVHARTWRCGERVVVRPGWLAPGPLAEDDVEIVVDPGNAFGSGSHPTTRLCLAAVESHVRPGARVLDVGCGSGLLGVAAARLGAAHVEAIDVDPEALRVTAATASSNGVAGRVHTSAAPLAELGSFDLVLANLLLPIVEDLGPELLERVAPGGRLVVSGLLAEQVPRALLALGASEPVDRLDEEGWVALVL